MRPLARLVALTIALTVPTAAHADYDFTFFPATQWGISDAALGLSPKAAVEDFEDSTLIAGVTVQVLNSSTGSYGPTGTLPNIFNPSTDDCCGSAFVSGTWDGSHLLLDTGKNQSVDYALSAAWGDIVFGIAGGANQIGFSMQQVAATGLTFTINDGDAISLASIPGYQFLVEDRAGYLRIDASGDSPPIMTLKIDGATGDGWAIDHLAVTVPEPRSGALMALGLALIAAFSLRGATSRGRINAP